MQIEQTRWMQGEGWMPMPPGRLGAKAQLVLLFGSPACLKQTGWQDDIRVTYPAAHRLGCSTAGESVVRTILGINEAEHSLTLAGDLPPGGYVRLMKANFDRLIDRAVGAGPTSHEAIGKTSPELALLISCVGRKLVLKQRIEEEVEGVREVLGRETVLAGFYSYGEISPFNPSARCELHN